MKAVDKTEARNKLSLEATLCTVAIIKITEIEPFYKNEPPIYMIKYSNSAAFIPQEPFNKADS